MPEIFVGSDHRGFEEKQKIVAALSGATSSPDDQIPVDGDYLVSDLGPFSYDEDDDYNDAAIKVARAVREHAGSFGILICGSAHGISIQANRFKGVRAIEGFTPDLAKIGREHNDANVLCLSADYENNYQEIIANFLNTKFSGEERHLRRIKRLDDVFSEDKENA